MADKKELAPELKEMLKEEYSQEWRKELRKSIPAKERMKISRKKMPERSPEVRNQDFNEVNLGLPAQLAREEAKRCLDCANPQCVLGCPVGIDIPSFIKLIEIGDFTKSVRKLKETNSLPSICGRVCPQEVQCEEVCNLKKATGVPVAIGNLERFAADYERENGEVFIPKLPPSTGQKAAIIGAGPAGLTVAGDLARKGHQCTIFEALHVAGGVLVYGIPEFRLPKKILEAEVDYLRQMGVGFKMNYVVGMTASLEDLKKAGYDAFFIGTGAGLPNFMRIPGENLIGIYSANEYLTRVNLMRAYDFPEYDTPVYLGKRAVVLGGGNVAMDSVRTAKRLGAEKATIVYRRSRKEMPARTEEIHHAEEEGIEFHFLTTPIKFIGGENGKVKAMECIQMELGEPDESGRRRPVPIPGSEFIMEVDLVVVAIGNSPNPLIPQTNPELKVGKWGNVEVDWDTMATSIPGVYAGGDIIRGGATVILAMGDARVAAREMDRYLNALKRTKGKKKKKETR
ncbi:MAG: NADPH-dependent glutamate synthase [Candidatus Aminicenantes bacterium]|nr:NADPH-dependent glutamate synthase [Candidatus Aminicenantes bacterium]MDH5466369.1 NADPH-dependent glutamate synthase [Candidatus Aminicenantes bacterium]MDH5704753.1 NADPH-dependent glutamate synthase [Candidatus Aminicenantes bacterium]